MKKKLILGLCSMLFTIIVFAQTTATGKVVDEKGAGLAGASVLEKGTKNGTTTGSDGSYSLKVSKAGAKLTISNVGFESVTVDAGAGVKTTMFIENKTLTEVVVTGVGSATTKKKLPIEVATLSTKDAAKSVTGSVEQALMGKIAGAQVQFQSGTPGSSASIILRGLNSLGETQPLIMVDGIEVSDINGIDLGNVDRVEVVKGAAGGMLYGAQGGNGVIQIFTKKGNQNKKPEITLLSQVSSGTVINNSDGIFAKYHSFETNAQGFITGSGAQIQRDAEGAWDSPDFMDANTDPNVKNNKVYKEQLYDHFAQAYRRAYTTNFTLGVNGGGEKSDYSFNLSRYDETNVMSNRYYRTSIGSNIGFELAKGLTFRNSLQAIFTNDDLLSGDADASIGGTGTSRFALFNSFPYIDFTYKNPQGYTVVSANGGDKTTKNVLSEPEWRTRTTNRIRIIENANFNYKISRNFELDYKYGIEFNITDRTNYYKNQSNAPQSANAFWGQSLKGSIRNDSYKRTRQNSLATLFIKSDFEKDFKINFPLKTTTQITYDYRRSERKDFFAQGTELPAYPPYNVSVATNKTSGDFYSTFVTYGLLFNQTFDYNDLLGVSLGLRSDYSSVFGEGSKAQTFNRGTFYFRPTQIVKIPGISEWKLRAAYGGAGIQPSVYENQPSLSVSTLGTGTVLSSSSSLANPALGVQESYETEVGTDITFNTKSNKWFTNLSIGLTYWNHDSKAIIQAASLPLTSGASSINDNLSTTNARGIDFSLDATVLATKKLEWNLAFRLGTTRSKMVTIANGADIVDGLFTLKAGQEIGLLSYQAPLTSITQVNPGTKAAYLTAGQQATAQIVNGFVTDTTTKRVYMGAQTDAQTVGSFYPKFTASITNSFNINKKITLSFQLDIVSGNKIYNIARQWLYRDRLSADFDRPVTINGQTGAFVAYYNSLYNSISPSTWFVEDGSFARLRDLSLTYQLPSTIKFLKNSSITLSARNILTFTNYSGADPEATSTADAQGNESSEKRVGAVKGVDYFGVPNLKSLQATLRLGF